MSFLEKNFRMSNFTYHKLANRYFHKFTRQIVQYTLSNGLTITGDKKRLGRRFDKTLIEATIYAFWGGIAWLFPRRVSDNEYEIIAFNVLEAFELLDEVTGNIGAFVWFHRLNDEKPMNVELYEINGLTKFQITNNEIILTEPKISYKFKRTRWTGFNPLIENQENYPAFPVVPLYANMLHESEFSDSFKSLCDAYDFINSDLVDTITQAEGIYWALKNYGGEDARELVETIQQWKALTADDDNASADSHVLEAPYQGKLATLDSLTRDMYNDFMALDTKALTGGSLTNVAINVAKTDLDLKADELEWQVADTVEAIMELVGMEYEEPQFKRRTITNDTENINNVSTQLSDGIIDIEEAVFMTPNILEHRKADLLERLAIAAQEQADTDFEMEQDEDETDVDAEV